MKSPTCLPDLTQRNASRQDWGALATDILQEQIQFIQSLGEYAEQNAAFVLRFITCPSERRTRLFFLAKVFSPYERQSRMSAEDVWQAISSSFPRHYALSSKGMGPVL